MLKVILVFHAARNDNLGVGALTAAELEILRSISRRTGREIHCTIVDGWGARPIYITGPDVSVEEVKVLRNPMHFFRLARRADLVIDIGAGDSFTDIYGRKRLIVLFMLKYMTHFAGRPLVLAPQTVGPFNSPISKLLAKISIRRCAIRATRDAMSTKCARDLGVTEELIEASDVALRLPYTKPEPSRQGGPVKVGINVSGLLMNGGYTGKNMFGLQVDYQQLVTDLVQRFTEHPQGCEVHLVPHVITWDHGEVEDDLHACQKLAKEFPEAIVAPAFETPSQAKSYIASLDFFMGARMHSCIAAFSSGVPVVPMAYSRKFAGLFGSLGYDYTVDCQSDPADRIIQRIMSAFEDRDDVKAEMDAAFARGLEKLGAYEAALENLVVSVR